METEMTPEMLSAYFKKQKIEPHPDISISDDTDSITRLITLCLKRLHKIELTNENVDDIMDIGSFLRDIDKTAFYIDFKYKELRKK